MVIRTHCKALFPVATSVAVSAMPEAWTHSPTADVDAQASGCRECLRPFCAAGLSVSCSAEGVLLLTS